MLAVRTLWILGLLSVGLLLALAVFLSPLKSSILELQFAFTPRAFGAIVHQWSAEDLQRYRSHFPADFALLLAYGSFGVVFVRTTRVFKQTTRGLKRLACWTLPAAAICDATENSLHLWLTEVPRFSVGFLYLASSSLSALKFALLIGFGLLVARELLRTEA